MGRPNTISMLGGCGSAMFVPMENTGRTYNIDPRKLQASIDAISDSDMLDLYINSLNALMAHDKTREALQLAVTSTHNVLVQRGLIENEAN